MTGFQSKRQASKSLLEQALNALMCCSPDHKAGAALQIKTVAELRAHLAEPAVAHPDPWREAIDAELVCLHLGTVESFPTAQAALAALIDWHVAVALDPEVSSAAQALIDRGAAVAEPLIDEMDAVASRYAHKLALDLECVLSNYIGPWYDTAMQTLSEYRMAMNRIHERESPTFMGEPDVRNRTSGGSAA